MGRGRKPGPRPSLAEAFRVPLPTQVLRLLLRLLFLALALSQLLEEGELGGSLSLRLVDSCW